MPKIDQLKLNDFSKKNLTNLNWYAEIWIEMGMLDRILDWCKMFSPNIWKWELLDSPALQAKGHYRFFFEEERDYLQFILTWS